MSRKICLIIVSLLSIIECQAAEKNQEDSQIAMNKTEVLETVTHKYLEFINQLGRGEEFDQEKVAETLLTTDCKKVLNGVLFTKSRKDFVADLINLYKNQGGWKVRPAEIIMASSNNTAILRLFIEMQKSGVYTTIVILRFDSNNLITEINEVLNEVKGAYDF